MSGAWSKRKDQLTSTPLAGLISTLTPNIGGSGGGCPVWNISISLMGTNYGTFNASPPCYVWSFLRVMVMLGALILARALIFGG